MATRIFRPFFLVRWHLPLISWIADYEAIGDDVAIGECRLEVELFASLMEFDAMELKNDDAMLGRPQLQQFHSVELFARASYVIEFMDKQCTWYHMSQLSHCRALWPHFADFPHS